MRIVNPFKSVMLLVLFGTFFLSCDKDDDNTPKTGYFTKTVKVTDGQHLDYIISLDYDQHNQLVAETFTDQDGNNHRKLTYGYNQHGQMTEYKEEGEELLYKFEYEDGVIVKMLEYDPETGELWDEQPISFSNGIYSMDDDIICKVDAQNQLLEIPFIGIVFSYGSENGVHPHLALSPARYFIGDRDIEFAIYDLTLSNKELKGWVKQDENFVVENTRNEAGLIIKADGTMVAGSRELIVEGVN